MSKSKSNPNHTPLKPGQPAPVSGQYEIVGPPRRAYRHRAHLHRGAPVATDTPVWSRVYSGRSNEDKRVTSCNGGGELAC